MGALGKTGPAERQGLDGSPAREAKEVGMASRSSVVNDTFKVAALVTAAITFGPVMVALAFLLPVLAYLVLPALFVVSIVAFPSYLASAGVRHVIQTRRVARKLAAVSISGERVKPGVQSQATALATVSVPSVLAVAARVVESNGVCPAGHQFRVADEFVFPNGHAVPDLCKKAEKAMRPYVAGLRTGELEPGQQWVCQGPFHKVVFRIDPVTVPGSAGTGGRAAA